MSQKILFPDDGSAGWASVHGIYFKNYEGKSCVKIPMKQNIHGSLSQIAGLPESVDALRIQYTYRTESMGPGVFTNTVAGGYEPFVECRFVDGQMHWITGGNRKPYQRVVPPSETWATDTFTVPRPEGSLAVNLVINVSAPRKNGLYVAEVHITGHVGTRRMAGQSVSVHPLASGNLLGELATSFEAGSAGWQIQHAPSPSRIFVPMSWETKKPGEGKRSLIIRPGFSLVSFPVFPKPATGYTLSFLQLLGACECVESETACTNRQAFPEK